MHWRYYIFWGVLMVALVAISLSAVFGIVLPLVWRLHFGERPPSTTLDVSVLLSVLLTLLALLVGAFGGGAYYVLTREIRGEARQAIDKAGEATRMGSQQGMAAALTNQGIYYWKQYEFSRDDGGSPEFIFLRLAIEVTNDAYDFHASQLSEDNPQYDETICRIRNNWVYYVAEMNRQGQEVSDGDVRLARQYADYLEQRLVMYPGNAHDWSDTIAFVRSHVGEPSSD